MRPHQVASTWSCRARSTVRASSYSVTARRTSPSSMEASPPEERRSESAARRYPVAPPGPMSKNIRRMVLSLTGPSAWTTASR
jgi:hypothetical protein